MTSSSKLLANKNKLSIFRNRNKIWLASSLALVISIIGFLYSSFSPEIGLPLRPGIDFTGGTQIRIDRKCENECSKISSESVNNALNNISFSDKQQGRKIAAAKVQFLDEYKSLLIRLPSLSPSVSQTVIKSIKNIAGPYEIDGQSIETIGPTLGSELLRTSLKSLFIAFIGVALYISIRFDRRLSVYALLALLHDVVIVCGVFSWLGILFEVEINSLFAVALLTIAGYSVNDTVVVFDRIRELNRQESKLSNSQKIDIAVSATLTRTIYTSGTTLLPLFALIFFGGNSLYWFSVALAIGVIVGSWSSIALVPSILTLIKDN